MSWIALQLISKDSRCSMHIVEHSPSGRSRAWIVDEWQRRPWTLALWNLFTYLSVQSFGKINYHMEKPWGVILALILQVLGTQNSFVFSHCWWAVRQAGRTRERAALLNVGMQIRMYYSSCWLLRPSLSTREQVEFAFIDSHPAKITNCSAVQLLPLRACRAQQNAVQSFYSSVQSWL